MIRSRSDEVLEGARRNETSFLTIARERNRNKINKYEKIFPKRQLQQKIKRESRRRNIQVEITTPVRPLPCAGACSVASNQFDHGERYGRHDIIQIKSANK